MRIVSIGVCGPNEKYLAENLNQRALLADDVIIVGNHIDDASKKLIKKFGFWFYEDDREWGKAQPFIKTDLLKRAGKLQPDWILACDMDEIYDESFDRPSAENLARSGGIGWYFYIVNLWNDRSHFHRGLSFWNIRFYRFAPEYGLEFQRKALHCGLGPPIVYHYGNYAPYLLKHYGLMDPEARQKKIERYEKYDPNAVYKDRSYYDALKYAGNVAVFDEAEMHRRVEEEVSTYKLKAMNQVQHNNEPEVFVQCHRLADGALLDMPKKHWEDIQRDPKRKVEFEFVREVSKSMVQNGPVTPPIQKDELECPICGLVAKTKLVLGKHKKDKHK